MSGRRWPPPSGSAPRVAGRAVVGLGVGVYAWWATGLETFSAESTWAIVGAGAVAVVVGTWRRRMAGRQSPLDSTDRPEQRPGLGIWLGLLAVLVVWQMSAYVQEPREDHPTLSYLVNHLLDTHGARTVACAAWLVGAERLARGEAT